MNTKNLKPGQRVQYSYQRFDAIGAPPARVTGYGTFFGETVVGIEDGAYVLPEGRNDSLRLPLRSVHPA